MIGLAERRLWAVRVVAAVTVCCFAWTFLFAKNCLAQTGTQIPSGTVVIVKTNTTLTPEQLNIGDTVDLSVVNDVVIDGKVVIAAGAAARGEIVSAKKRNFIGIAGKIGMVLQSAQAVDGSSVQIRGSKIVEGEDKMVMSIGLSLICCILFALIKGGEAVVPAGVQIEAQVSSTTTVNV